MNTSRSLARSALVAAALLSSGCNRHSRYMMPSIAVAPPPPSAGNAVVVFVRPSYDAPLFTQTIMDEHGAFVGASEVRTWFAVSMRPGPHTFVVWAENTDVLRADLAPGRTYFVEVAPSFGAVSPQAHLFALSPRSEHWSELGQWMHDVRAREPLSEAGNADLQRRAPAVAERLRRARERLERYSPEDLARRTLRSTDGV